MELLHAAMECVCNQCIDVVSDRSRHKFIERPSVGVKDLFEEDGQALVERLTELDVREGVG